MSTKRISDLILASLPITQSSLVEVSVDSGDGTYTSYKTAISNITISSSYSATASYISLADFNTMLSRSYGY